MSMHDNVIEKCSASSCCLQMQCMPQHSSKKQLNFKVSNKGLHGLLLLGPYEKKAEFMKTILVNLTSASSYMSSGWGVLWKICSPLG